MALPAIILAAGTSRRLGQPKQLVLVGGETLLARTMRVVQASGAEPVLVVLGAHRERILAEVDFAGVQVVVNTEWEQGIASSIRAGISGLAEICPDAAATMLLVCDQPCLTAEHLRALTDGFQVAAESSIMASEYSGITGIPAIFPPSQFARLLALEGDVGARFLLKRPEIPVIGVRFEGGEADVDTAEDLAKL